MKKILKYKILFFLCVSVVSTAFTQNLEWNGQVSGWGMVNRADETEFQLGVRYLPEVYTSIYQGNTLSIDAEFSANLFSYRDFDAGNTDHDEKLYRAWLRFSTSTFEARIGLQKINFGPAFMLRSLMWFDSLDPRDPQQLTDGVYGVLIRYYFLNNANIWLWGLLQNDELKGTEFIYSDKNTPEWGGRIQHPLGQGEVAITVHHRETDINKTIDSYIPLPIALDIPNITEQRYALDGKWDYELGFWFEAVSSHFELKDLVDHPLLQYSSMMNNSAFDFLNTEYLNQFTLGSDYTFGWGNGLHVLGEYMFLNTGESVSFEQDYTFSAVLLDYPLNMFDQLMGLIYYDHENKNAFWYANWRRTYDHWSLNLMAFHYPETPGMAIMGRNQASLGKGIQVLLIYNH